MARKKMRKGRRRRVGGMALNARSPLVKAGAIAAGYFLAATPVNAMIDKLVAGKIDSKIVGAGQAGLGGLLLFGKNPSLIKTALGGVAAGAGLKRLLTSFGVVTAPVAATTTPAVTSGLNGYGNVPVIGRRVAGYGNVPVIGNARNGYTPNSTLGAYVVPSGSRPGVNRNAGVMGSRDGSGLINN